MAGAEVLEPRNPWSLAGPVHPGEGCLSASRDQRHTIGGTLKMELINTKEVSLGT